MPLRKKFGNLSYDPRKYKLKTTKARKQKNNIMDISNDTLTRLHTRRPGDDDERETSRKS